MFTKTSKDNNFHVLYFVTCLDVWKQPSEDLGVYEIDIFTICELFPIVLSHQ